MEKNDKVTMDDMEKAIAAGIEKYISVRLGMGNKFYSKGWEDAKQELERYAINNIKAEAFINIAEGLFEEHAFLLQKYKQKMIMLENGFNSNRYHFENGYCDILYCVIEYMGILGGY